MKKRLIWNECTDTPLCWYATAGSNKMWQVAKINQRSYEDRVCSIVIYLKNDRIYETAPTVTDAKEFVENYYKEHYNEIRYTDY